MRPTFTRARAHNTGVALTARQPLGEVRLGCRDATELLVVISAYHAARRTTLRSSPSKTYESPHFIVFSGQNDISNRGCLITVNRACGESPKPKREEAHDNLTARGRAGVLPGT